MSQMMKKTMIVATVMSARMAEGQRGSTIPRGAGGWHVSPQAEDHVAHCRCVSNNGKKAISICNSGCGAPNQVCTTDFGCTAENGQCDNRRCTCRPAGMRFGDEMTFRECQRQCNRVNMRIPANNDEKEVGVHTGCNTNKNEMWVDPLYASANRVVMPADSEAGPSRGHAWLSSEVIKSIGLVGVGVAVAVVFGAIVGQRRRQESNERNDVDRMSYERFFKDGEI